ncbi:MAG TPA: c-type cytochrome [Candidatus Kapabacteria bacterium]|nr:c-type cytochrome [Candidatus Kapabacteria bacterium]
MRRTLTSYAVAACAVALCALAACKSDSGTNPPATTGDKTHGEYLVKNVAVCGDCHTQRGMTGLPIDSLTMAGGVAFSIPSLGTVYSRNLTSDSTHGIGAWTDQQIITAIRTGIAPMHMHNGVAMDSVLFPVMPYWLYGYLTDSDVKDIVAYLRTLKAVSYDPPMDTIPAVARVTWPKQAGIPDATTNDATTQRGKYLVTIAACIDCHTIPAATATNPLAPGINTSLFLAGGRPFETIEPGRLIMSKNITPDVATGIGSWTSSQIDSAFAFGWDDEHRALCPPMPWQAFNGMTSTDRAAIVAYLRGIPAVNNAVPEDTTLHCPHP